VSRFGPLLVAVTLLLTAEGALAMAVSLDGQWMLAPDSDNRGRAEQWCNGPVEGARPTPVPWIIQEVFPGYHGVAWYWREFNAPARPFDGARYVLRFWAVDYLCDVYVNGVAIGSHEGPEDQFEFDITSAVKPGETNSVAVRVLNPTNEPIDGIRLQDTPRRNKTYPVNPGSDYNYGGITDSVELLVAPAARITDLFVRPDANTGVIRVQVTAGNADAETTAMLSLSVGPATSGETLATVQAPCTLATGDTRVEATLTVPQPHLWDLGDPFLYRVAARLTADGAEAFDEVSTRCGFRDFRFEDGYFRLNGRRIFLRGSHTGADTPVGIRVPYDPDLVRRDLLNVKAMGFNMIRFIAGVARRCQLDFADELGLLVYEESFASWLLGESPWMPERFDRSTEGMILRDRNHASIVMWGLLNETSPTPVFFHAADALPKVVALDDTRVVMLNSGRFDGLTRDGAVVGPAMWRVPDETVPCVTCNVLDQQVSVADSTWPPGTLALHPGIGGQYAVLRWTCPQAGDYHLAARFKGIARKPTTTDVHVLVRGSSVYDGLINVGGGGNTAAYEGDATLSEGDTIDVAVGPSGDGPFSDTTALALTIEGPGRRDDAAAEFTLDANPTGPWTYGWLPAGERPDVAGFVAFTKTDPAVSKAIGSIANPGSDEWEDILSDQHPYQRVPHTAPIMHTLRSLSGDGKNVFVSEYGVGSAVDLWRAARHYERLGKTHCEDAVAYRTCLDRFLADYDRWNMADTFARPADYFRQCVAKMAALRGLGVDALRSNPNVIGYSLTGTQDQGYTGEGLTTTFRELKPGTVDALYESLAPLRLCVFTEPVSVYCGDTVRVDVVLADEDGLGPGDYPVRVQVLDPLGKRLLDHTVSVTVPEGEPPFALPVLAEDVAVDGPTGRYRVVADMLEGGAPTGGEAVFYGMSRSDMPPVLDPVVLWGDDSDLADRLRAMGVQAVSLDSPEAQGKAAILVGASAAGVGDAEWQALADRISAGSTVVFLCPEVFRVGDDPAARVPLGNRGRLATMANWVYLKDEWAKRHSIFEGLQCGGLMDYTFYREIIPDLAWADQDPPEEAVAGANNTSQGYASGLLVAVHRLGEGRVVLNTLRIRQNLGTDPVAERLLRNMLRFAGGA